MTDTSMLDGTVDEVKTGLAGLDGATLTALLATEQAGKNRKGVVDALTVAQTSAATAGDVQGTSPDHVALDAERGVINAATAAGFDTSGPANVAPASEFEPSGAPVQTTEIDLGHPALDANPRAHTTVDQNRIDFNDPTLDGREVVERALKAQQA